MSDVKGHFRFWPTHLTLRTSFALLLLFAVAALQLGSRWMVYAAFKANQAYIAKELCENKARPELGCEGQCCLKRQLEKAKEQERKAPRLLEVEVVPCTVPEPVVLSGALLLTAAPKESTQHAWPTNDGAPAGAGSAVWQPPRV